jgi:hypothetical protein
MRTGDVPQRRQAPTLSFNPDGLRDLLAAKRNDELSARFLGLLDVFSYDPGAAFLRAVDHVFANHANLKASADRTPLVFA